MTRTPRSIPGTHSSLDVTPSKAVATLISARRTCVRRRRQLSGVGYPVEIRQNYQQKSVEKEGWDGEKKGTKRDENLHQ